MPVLSLIMSLCQSVRPLYIAYSVMAFIVLAFQREIRRWLPAYLLKELFKRSEQKLDTAAAIVLKIRTVSIITTIFSRSIGSVLYRRVAAPRFPVANAASNKDFKVTATAGRRASAHQGLPVDFFNRAALTFAPPVMICTFPTCVAKNFQARKRETVKIVKAFICGLWNDVYTHLDSISQSGQQAVFV